MYKLFLNLAIASLAVAAPKESPKESQFAPINKFTFKLLDNTFAFQENFGRKNFAVSPLSVWNAFSLLTEGSAGNTFQELMTSLNLPKDLKATQALHRAASEVVKYNSKDVVLNGQSAIFADGSLTINPEFCEAATAYNTDIYSVHTKNTTMLANDINEYMCLATQGKITDAVEPDTLENLVMLLIDGLYFKANWTHSFDESDTTELPFYNYHGKIIGTVNMMYREAPLNLLYSTDLKAEALEMPYGDAKDFSMIVLLPFDGVSMKKFLHTLSSAPLGWLNELKAAKSSEKVECLIPRFKISCQVDLSTPLKYSGIHSIFDSDKAQLPGVSATPLFVSKALQNVKVEVNEMGTEAAAATVIGFETRFGAPVFKANREFVFLVVDRRSDVILFAGVYDTPSLV